MFTYTSPHHTSHYIHIHIHTYINLLRADVEKGEVVKALLPRMNQVHLGELLHLVTPMLCRDFIGQLPSEIALKILSYLDEGTLCNCEQVQYVSRACEGG